MLAYTDAAPIAGSTGGTFVSVTAGRTRAQELTTALATLANVRIDPLGLVMTSAPRSALEHGTVRTMARRLGGLDAERSKAGHDGWLQATPRTPPDLEACSKARAG